MKKFLSMLFAGIAILALNGCGGGSGAGDSTYDTYFITDSDGIGVEGIIYYCDSGIQGMTNIDGAFNFDAYGDICDFDLVTNTIVGDLYLESDADPYTDAGINGIEYECIGYNTNPDALGVTRYDTLFGLNGYIDDASFYTQCTLYNLP